MNKMTLIGNLTADPVVREVNSAAGPLKVCNFNVAVNEKRNGQDHVTYFNVAAWRGLADICKQYLTKGSKVYVGGPLTARTYTANDGTTRVSLEVQANDFEILSTQNRANTPAQPAAPAAAPAPAYTPAPTTGFEAIQTDELPF